LVATLRSGVARVIVVSPNTWGLPMQEHVLLTV
jgi:hypothetical protein